jgi:hypothetical protein
MEELALRKLTRLGGFGAGKTFFRDVNGLKIGEAVTRKERKVAVVQTYPIPSLCKMRIIGSGHVPALSD